MSDRLDTKDPSPGQASPTATPAAEYQPPAIAWEEPLEAIAAQSCTLVYLQDGCEGSPTT